MSDTLVVVPTYVRSDADLETTMTTLRSLRRHEPDVEVMVVDDLSPERGLLRAALESLGDEGIAVCWRDENGGFSRAVNVGLRRCLDSGQHALLCNADVEFHRPVLPALETSLDSRGRPAAVSGALLLYDTGLIQHGGVYVDLLLRAFDHRFRFSPGGLPEAHLARVCPVTGALQMIRNETLHVVGLYSEEFRMGYEDVDYCLRVFEEDLECVYDPRAIATHHESMFRGQADETGRLDEWHRSSLETLHRLHGKTSLGRFVPPIA